MRSHVVSSENFRSLTFSEHIRAQKVLMRQLCRRATDRGSDVRLDTGQLMRPHVWPRQPTDPSRWTWKQLHSWKWQHIGHITGLDMRPALTAIRWRPRGHHFYAHGLFCSLTTIPCGACQSRSSSRKLSVCRAEDSCNPALQVEQALDVYADTDRNLADMKNENMKKHEEK